MGILLSWGKDAVTGEAIHVNKAARGLACNCVCPDPNCGEPLIAKKGENNEWHFAHVGNCVSDNLGESVLHLLAKAIIKANRHIILPDGTVFSYLPAEIEYCIKDMRIDAVLTCKQTGERLIVEIIVTNPLDPGKLERLRNMKYRVMTIDLGNLDYNIGWDELEQVVITQTDTKDLYSQSFTWPRMKIEWDMAKIVAFAVLVFGGLWLLNRWLFGGKKERRSRFRYSSR